MPITPPVYLQGYYFFDDEREYGAMYQRYFDVKSAMKMEKSSLITDWPGTNCAVHVRRGDLAQMNDVFYGKVTVDYFRKAISYVKNHFENVKFFFFSDEIEWVEENLYEFYKNSPYVLVRGNCAYEDLNLMAHCDCFISSQGSAGKVAAMMNGKGLLIVSSDPHDVVWKERYYNTFIIDV